MSDILGERLYIQEDVLISIHQKKVFLNGTLELMYQNSNTFLFWSISKQRNPVFKLEEQQPLNNFKIVKSSVQEYLVTGKPDDEYENGMAKPSSVFKLIVGGLCLPLVKKYFVTFKQPNKSQKKELLCLAPKGGWMNMVDKKEWELNFVFPEQKQLEGLIRKLSHQLYLTRVYGPKRYIISPSPIDFERIRSESTRLALLTQRRLNYSDIILCNCFVRGRATYENLVDSQKLALLLTDKKFEMIKKEDYATVDGTKWSLYFDECGRMKSFSQMKKDIFSGGITDELRWEAMKFLLGYYKQSMDENERKEHDQNSQTEYLKILRNLDDTKAFKKPLRKQFRQIHKDVLQIYRIGFYDRDEYKGDHDTLEKMLKAYVFYCDQENISDRAQMKYDQAMSDIIAVLYFHIRHEATTFWLFWHFIDPNVSLFQNIKRANYQPEDFHMYSVIEIMGHYLTYYRSDLFQLQDSFDLYEAAIPYHVDIRLCYSRSYSIEEVPRLWQHIWSQEVKNYTAFISLRTMLIRVNEFDAGRDRLKGYLRKSPYQRERYSPEVVIAQTNELMDFLRQNYSKLPSPIARLLDT